MDASSDRKSGFPDWVVILLLALLVLSQGGFAFYAVGDKGQPGWDYRPVPDTPGESAYAVYEPLPYPQHVRGEKGE